MVYIDLTDDPELFTAMMNYQSNLRTEEAQQFRVWAQSAIENLKNKTGEEKAEAVAEFFAEWFGPSTLGKGFSAAAKITKSVSLADKFLEKPAAYMRRYTKYFSRFGYAAEVAEVGSSERIFLALAEIEDVLPGSIPTLFEEGKIVGDIAKLSPAVQELVPELVEAAKVVTGKVEPYLCRDLKHLKWHDAIPAVIKDVACIPEFKTLAQKFDGMAHNLKEIGAKRITFKYEHTFLPDIVCERASRVSVGGFHHDYLGKIEKTGILNITKVAENAYGCYKIEWSYLNSRAKYSTMFPQFWFREKVMTSIQEAINNTFFYKLDGAEHIFRGKCLAEFNIEFIVDAAGAIVSAYPLM